MMLSNYQNEKGDTAQIHYHLTNVLEQLLSSRSFMGFLYEVRTLRFPRSTELIRLQSTDSVLFQKNSFTFYNANIDAVTS